MRCKGASGSSETLENEKVAVCGGDQTILCDSMFYTGAGIGVQRFKAGQSYLKLDCIDSKSLTFRLGYPVLSTVHDGRWEMGGVWWQWG